MFILPPSNIEYTKLSSGTIVNIQTQPSLHLEHNSGKGEIKVLTEKDAMWVYSTFMTTPHIYTRCIFPLFFWRISWFGDNGIYVSSAPLFRRIRVFFSRPHEAVIHFPPFRKSGCLLSVNQKYIYNRRRLSAKLNTFWNTEEQRRFPAWVKSFANKICKYICFLLHK